MNWILANWEHISLLVIGILNVASLYTGLTPDPKDDEYVKKLIAWFSFVKPVNAPGSVKLPFKGV
jgi:hypothetical protein